MSRLRAALLFGGRTAASGMLALFIAFWLQIDQPAWAATSAVIVAQPVLGASLRKGSFRLIGTLTGAAFSVLLYAAWPQDRWPFLIGLAAWGAACSFVSTFMRESASYAAMLAGYTAAIIAMDAVSAPDGVFLLAVARGSAIAIGIVCTTVVFSVTDLGGQRAYLAAALESLTQAVLTGLRGVLGADPAPLDAQREQRRALVRQVAALDVTIEQAAGENYDLRAREGVLRDAVSGLFTALSCWRGMEQHVRRLELPEAGVPGALQRELAEISPRVATAETLRRAGEALLAREAATASERLLRDRLGEALLGMGPTLSGVALLRDPLHGPARPGRATPAPQLGDPLAALVNASRAFAVVFGASLLWVLTGWSAGPVFVTFAMVVVMLYVLRDDAAFSGAAIMAWGCAGALIAALVVKFAALPWAQSQGFDGFPALAIMAGGLILTAAALAVLLPPGTFVAGVAFASMANFMPLFSPTNEIAYDYEGFLNTAAAIIAGASLGAAGYRLIPPLSPAVRMRRLLDGARADLRRLARGRWRPGALAWTRRMYARLVRMPSQASLLQQAQMLAALSVGHELLRSADLRARPAPLRDDAMRRAASRREIEEAVASHPAFFAGIPLRDR